MSQREQDVRERNAQEAADHEAVNGEKDNAAPAEQELHADPTAASEEQSEQVENPESAGEADTLRKQAEENYQRYLRAQADFDNFRRRSRQEKEEFAKYASMQLIEKLLPVVDNLERAIAVSREHTDADALAKGVDMVFRQLQQVLDQEGLQPIEAVGQPFNPEFHQAIMQVESEEHEEGTVVEEVQKGYKLKDKVLRPAMVKVSG